MPSSIGIDSAFGVNTTNPAVAFNVTSSSTSSFAPGRPALVDLTAEQEQPISLNSCCLLRVVLAAVVLVVPRVLGRHQKI